MTVRWKSRLGVPIGSREDHRMEAENAPLTLRAWREDGSSSSHSRGYSNRAWRSGAQVIADRRCAVLRPQQHGGGVRRPPRSSEQRTNAADTPCSVPHRPLLADWMRLTQIRFRREDTEWVTDTALQQCENFSAARRLNTLHPLLRYQGGERRAGAKGGAKTCTSVPGLRGSQPPLTICRH